MFEARLTWAGGALRVVGDGVPSDLERVREHLYETARLMGAGDVAMQLVVTAADAAPERSQRWVLRARDADGGRRARREDGRAGPSA
jgi:hypothetical protein